MQFTIAFLLLFAFAPVQAQLDSAFTETPSVLHTKNGDLFGTLTFPKGKKKVPVALLHVGSGPTDRNGNSMLTQNNAFKQMAHALALQGIATLRFDKRGIGESKASMKSEADLRFDDYVQDARAWLQELQGDKRFSKIYVVGHSEGSLIGMLAASGIADGFVSVSGPGKPAGALIRTQLESQPPMVKNAAFPILDSLEAGKTVAHPPAMLAALFRPSVQPYLISWFRYDPAKVLAKLNIPVLIIQGTTDLQVGVADARLLAAAQPRAKLVLVENMNHVLKNASADTKENMATYKQPDLPLNATLVKELVSFMTH